MMMNNGSSLTLTLTLRHDRITADGRFSDNYEILINTEVRSVPISKKGKLYDVRKKGKRAHFQER